MEVRRNKLAKPGLQLRLVGAFLCLACLGVCLQVVLLDRALLRLSHSMQTDGPRLLAELPDLLVGNVLLTLAVVLPVVSLVGIWVTHRVAGPIAHFERYLRHVGEGRSVGACEVRRGDELHGLCARINDALYRLHSELEEARAQAPALRARPVEDETEVQVFDSAA